MPQPRQRRVVIGGHVIGVTPFGSVFRTAGGLRPTRVGLGSLGGGDHRAVGIPTPSGGPDVFDLWPYDERGPPFGASDLPPTPPLIGAPAIPVPGIAGAYRPTTVPFGKIDPDAGITWVNPTTASSVPILASTPSATPVLTMNAQRNMLVIQNNSTAIAPDTTPVFYIGFNAPVASAGFGLALAAGIGITFDIICPRDSIFVLQAGGGGASLVVAGVVVQGTYAPL